MPKSSTKKAPKNPQNPQNPRNLDPALYAQLKAESEAPYRGLRKFVYLACGASGAIGGVVFLTQIMAGRDVANALPNLAVQVGVIALMVVLYRWEQKVSREESNSPKKKR
jgi:Low psii accumulation1 / Rep27